MKVCERLNVPCEGIGYVGEGPLFSILFASL